MTALLRCAIGAALIAFGTTAQAQDDEERRTVPLVQQLYECRAITDPAARLACFDRQVAALSAAEESREVRIVDREAVREARRGLFGFSLSGIGNLFGSGDDDEEEERADNDVVTQIDSTLTSVARGENGRLVLALENGQRWIQTDTGRGGRTPRAGEPVVIRRGALGSFIANIGDRPGIRVMRQR
ncbi:MAG: hypothetical protein K2X31_11810 [Sphingopyxis sp.]|nr:hypothetical protein [Sphingopyxis sp.]